ncbi:MAG: hypothetical protein JWN75_891 [Candidatus Saccharibacteria bacterium]|nr:hypothetical protein [Candidatus Saccharibacteria bacterium]
MAELPYTLPPSTVLDDDALATRYLDSLGTQRTARHASEQSYNSPVGTEVAEATRKIRNDIKGVFQESDDEHSTEERSLTEIKDDYWDRASKVGIEHGARAGFELDDYFKISPERSYEDIKAAIEHDFAPDSVPRSVLDAIDGYATVLGINPASATSITTELISRGLPRIQSIAEQVAESDGTTPLDANMKAFAQFVNEEVPSHINLIIDKYGTGDEAIRPYINKSSFYPEEEMEKKDVALVLSIDDVKGLIRVYDIQSRPYSNIALEGARELATIPAVQSAMIRVQEALVTQSEQYLLAHPERAKGDLRNFSEIFVPEQTETGVELLPNPKLLRAMVNNILPGVAESIQRREAPMKNVTDDDILQGTYTAAKIYKLFNMNIGQFKNFQESANTAELHSIYNVVCPANAHFPDFLTAKFGEFYEQERARKLEK